jgi:hypothetical protein
MATTVTEFITRAATGAVASATATGVRPQGGILDGENPTHYDAKVSPASAFYIQYHAH